jgi:glutamine amidotransferase
MCELLGMSANVPTDICFSFTGLVQRGGGTGPHKDGWGITFMKVKAAAHLKIRSPASSRRLRNWSGLSHQIVLGHRPYSPG